MTINKADEYFSIHKHSSCADNVWEIIGFPPNSTLSVFFDLPTTSATVPAVLYIQHFLGSPSLLPSAFPPRQSRSGLRRKQEHRGGGKKFVENPSHCRLFKASLLQDVEIHSKFELSDTAK
jgi:hypothetical protein